MNDRPPKLDALTRIPRSAVNDICWPAVPAPGPAMLLALQYQFDRSQWWPTATIEQHQWRQLGHLLDHAVATIPFYHRRLSMAGYHPGQPLTRAFWQSLPILRRQDVHAVTDALLSTAIPVQHGTIQRAATSGTTGTPINVAKTQLEQLIWQAITLREECWHERQWETTIAVIRGFPEGRYAYPDGGRVDDWGTPLADVYPTGPGVVLNVSSSVAQQAEWLCRHDPTYLLSEANNLRQLAAYFLESGQTLPRLREVRAVGDVVDEMLRWACRDAWGAAVVDIYSCTEAGYLALQCPEKEQLHVQMESVFLEVLDDAGRPCPPGVTGEVVVTPLHNFAMPFIRYAVGDRAEMGHACSCGRGLSVIKQIVGRSGRAAI